MKTFVPKDIPSLIDELGGLTAAARFFNEEPQTVGNWRLRKSIPTKLFFQHEAALKTRAIEAPKELWGFAEPASGEAA